MEKMEAIKILKDRRETLEQEVQAISVLIAEVLGKDDAPWVDKDAAKKKKTTKKKKAAKKSEAQTVESVMEEAEAEPQPEPQTDFDDLFDEDKKTPAEVKTLLIKWVNEDPNARRPHAGKIFSKITGLSSSKELTDENATEIYASLKATLDNPEKVAELLES